ncbi:hypothetical protein K432DRAFT_377442 [Lepidopterella palustris CBS 459.81]|uniref:Uncharacterized protein n=1 Tax=Lepidopterella palustris CBS 459.81 TaxID=1314670 RepID=A0A8E2JK62_9PEZI|nr:hypothetical protein K432DRAFT_377442 [Lepidopterella palustris CBS 459.81]
MLAAAARPNLVATLTRVFGSTPLKVRGRCVVQEIQYTNTSEGLGYNIREGRWRGVEDYWAEARCNVEELGKGVDCAKYVRGLEVVRVPEEHSH